MRKWYVQLFFDIRRPLFSVNESLPESVCSERTSRRSSLLAQISLFRCEFTVVTERYQERVSLPIPIIATLATKVWMFKSTQSNRFS